MFETNARLTIDLKPEKEPQEMYLLCAPFFYRDNAERAQSILKYKGIDSEISAVPVQINPSGSSIEVKWEYRKENFDAEEKDVLCTDIPNL